MCVARVRSDAATARGQLQRAERRAHAQVDPLCRALTSRELQAASPGESSAVVRARVLAARARQRNRGCLNALLPPSQLDECCALDRAGRRLVADAVDRGGMSARAVHRAMRVARTIADLAGEERTSVRALAEAVQFQGYETRRIVR